ncbi:MAG: AAA family ATPase [Planctomycetota bacterium]|jgi:MoxR-like ATPase
MQDVIQTLRDNISRVYFGDSIAVDRLLTCLMARGHALIEDVPGVGKTMLATSIARSIDCSFSRVQLTPDLLPADVLGVSIYDKTTSTFNFQRGPLFANVVLADEINRASPRTQSALLEAMNEATITIDGTTHPLEQPFLLIATQNPHEFEGTHPLPENQLDRFLMRLSLGYPDAQAETRLLEERPASTTLHDLKPVLHKTDLLDLQKAAEEIHTQPSLLEYVVQFATLTREHPNLRVGLSPRGALSLMSAARASALLDARDYCTPDDILNAINPVCAHRVVPYLQPGEQIHETAERVLEEIIQSVPSPV